MVSILGSFLCQKKEKKAGPSSTIHWAFEVALVWQRLGSSQKVLHPKAIGLAERELDDPDYDLGTHSDGRTRF